MTELSLHILDIAMNSVKAGASEIQICISVEDKNDELRIGIRDNGKGMSKAELDRILDPFYTTGNKKTGLGIPLLKQQAEQAAGKFSVESKPDAGCLVQATFRLSHIDRQPMGNIAGTMSSLIRSFPQIHWLFSFNGENELFALDTDEIKAELEGVHIDTPDVIEFIKSMISENIEALSNKKL